MKGVNPEGGQTSALEEASPLVSPDHGQGTDGEEWLTLATTKGPSHVVKEVVSTEKNRQAKAANDKAE